MDSPKKEEFDPKIDQSEISTYQDRQSAKTDQLENDNDDDESNYSDDEFGLNSKRLKIDEEVDDESSTKPVETTSDEKSAIQSSPLDKEEQLSSNWSQEKDSSQSLKVPPLKIICTKKDFGTPYLVIDQNAATATGSESSVDETKEQNEFSGVKEERCDESAATNSYSSASSTTSSASSDSYLNDNKSSQSDSKIKQMSTKKEKNLIQRQQIESASKSGSAKKLNAQVANSSGSSAKKTSGEKIESNNMIRRKLRSHTRQQQSDTPTEPAPVLTTKQKLISDDSKQDGSYASAHNFSEDFDANSQSNAKTNERKRKQRQQITGSEMLVDTSTALSDKNNQSFASECEANCASVCAGENAPITALIASTNCIKKFIEIRSQISRKHDELIQTKYKMSLPKNFDEFYLFRRNYLIESNKEARLAIPFVCWNNLILFYWLDLVKFAYKI